VSSDSCCFRKSYQRLCSQILDSSYQDEQQKQSLLLKALKSKLLLIVEWFFAFQAPVIDVHDMVETPDRARPFNFLFHRHEGLVLQLWKLLRWSPLELGLAEGSCFESSWFSALRGLMILQFFRWLKLCSSSRFAGLGWQPRFSQLLSRISVRQALLFYVVQPEFGRLLSASAA
jgi:hypothetical protein